MSSLPLVAVSGPEQARAVMLITCPVTRTDELVADRRIRSAANHPTHVALSVECPSCGSVHVYRTGRRWESRPTGPSVRPAAELTRT
jgi:RNase P subunit RPR2